MRQNSGRVVFVCLVTLLVVALAPVSGCRGKKTSADVAPATGWFDDLRDRIRSKFDEPGQVTALLGIVDQMEADMVELDREVADYYARITALDREHGTTREQFQKAIDAFNERQRVAFDEMLVHVKELKRIAGREGWKTLSDIDKTLYESWQREL